MGETDTIMMWHFGKPGKGILHRLRGSCIVVPLWRSLGVRLAKAKIKGVWHVVAQNGYSDAQIISMDRWQSIAFQKYIQSHNISKNK